MFSKCKLYFLSLVVLISSFADCFAADKVVAPVDVSTLPINTVDKKQVAPSNNDKVAPALVSPSKPQAVTTEKVAVKDVQPNVAPKKDDFDFDLKMKSKNSAPLPAQETKAVEVANPSQPAAENVDDLPKDIQYKSSPIEHLGNNILSQIDDDLFTQMSEIEKSTTLLTLELKREKLRNEIEAQKAIRQKNKDDLEQQKTKQRLEEFERKKQIEAELLSAKQNLLNKEQLCEVLKQLN